MKSPNADAAAKQIWQTLEQLTSTEDVVTGAKAQLSQGNTKEAVNVLRP
jgi:hypothetical protein